MAVRGASAPRAHRRRAGSCGRRPRRGVVPRLISAAARVRGRPPPRSGGCADATPPIMTCRCLATTAVARSSLIIGGENAARVADFACCPPGVRWTRPHAHGPRPRGRRMPRAGPATIAPQPPGGRAFTEPSTSLWSRPPPRVHGVGNAGNGGSRCGCACPAAGSHAPMTPRTSTPAPTTRRPTTPWPPVIRAAHNRGGVMSINAQSEWGLCAVFRNPIWLHRGGHLRARRGRAGQCRRWPRRRDLRPRSSRTRTRWVGPSPCACATVSTPPSGSGART
jgi:hypothetical protein